MPEIAVNEKLAREINGMVEKRLDPNNRAMLPDILIRAIQRRLGPGRREITTARGISGRRVIFAGLTGGQFYNLMGHCGQCRSRVFVKVAPGDFDCTVKCVACGQKYGGELVGTDVVEIGGGQ